MANNEHIQMKNLEIIEKFDLRKQEPTQIFGEASPKSRDIKRGGQFQVFELSDSSFVVISQN